MARIERIECFLVFGNAILKRVPAPDLDVDDAPVRRLLLRQLCRDLVIGDVVVRCRDDEEFSQRRSESESLRKFYSSFGLGQLTIGGA